ncbi:hypothetical protein FOZ63_011772, partial [Perkinsus olseni]
ELDKQLQTTNVWEPKCQNSLGEGVHGPKLLLDRGQYCLTTSWTPHLLKTIRVGLSSAYKLCTAVPRPWSLVLKFVSGGVNSRGARLPKREKAEAHCAEVWRRSSYSRAIDVVAFLTGKISSLAVSATTPLNGKASVVSLGVKLISATLSAPSWCL